MFFSRFCFTFLFIPIVIDTVHSVLTDNAKNRGSRSTVDDILILDKKSERQFSLDLNDQSRNLSSTGVEDKESDGGDEIKFTDTGREFGKKKKSRTFLSPLSLDFKDKFNPKRGIIYDTRESFGGGFISGFSCCGSRYGSPSYSERPEYGFGGSSEGGRYPSRPSERPGNRYGSASSSFSFDQSNRGNRPEGIGGDDSFGGSYPSRYGPPRGSYGGSSDGDRYGNSRPGYGSDSSSFGGFSGSGGQYGRPSFSIGGSGGYGGQGGGYGDSGFGGGRPGGGYGGFGSGGGSYGGSGQGNFEGSVTGGFGIGRPGGGGYEIGSGQSGFGGSFGSGGNGGSIGFSSFGSTDGFSGGGDYGYGDGGGGHGNSVGGNIQTQKALALKALAGVALIGAAAALATNPVLLPLGVAHGRKKRSTAGDDFWNEHPLMLLKAYISQIPQKDIGKEDIALLSQFLISRKCVARLACEVQREYFAAFERYKDVNDSENSIYHNLEDRFMDLVQSNILNNGYVNEHIKKEIKLALALGARRGNCQIFPCIRPNT